MKNAQRFTALIALTLIMIATTALATEGVSPGALDRLAVVETRCPTFSWGMDGEAVAYDIVTYLLPEDASQEVELTADSEVLFTRVAGSATSWTPSADQCFAPGGRYVWFVRAVNELAGEEVVAASEWSAGRYFTVPAAPSVDEVARALEVLQRYVSQGGDGQALASTVNGSSSEGPSAPIKGGDMGSPKSITTAPAAIRGANPEYDVEAYGVVGVTNSVYGAGVAAANTEGGPDLLLDGSFDGGTNTSFYEWGLDRSSPNDETFWVRNIGGGTMTLDVFGTLRGTALDCPGCIDPSDLAEESVTSDAIEDRGVTDVDIAEGAVSGYHIFDGSIHAEDLAADAIADGSITTADLADGAVTGPKIGVGAVYGVNIADDAVGSDQIEFGGVRTDDIDFSAVTSSRIADGTIVSADLADESVTSPKIEFGGVLSDHLAAGSVTTAAILDGTIRSGDLGDGTVTSAKILNGTITAADLAPESVGSNAIEDGGVSTADIDASAVGTGQLADGAVTAAKLAPGAIGPGSLADGSVTSAAIANGAVAAVDLANGAVIGTKLADDAVGARHLAAGAVGSVAIADGGVGPNDLGALSVRTASIADSAVTSGKLNDGAVTTSKIADGTITADDVSASAGIYSSRSSVYKTSNDVHIDPGLADTVTAFCYDYNDLPLSGGCFDWAGFGMTLMSSYPNYWDSASSIAGYSCEYRNNTAYGSAVFAYIYCIEVP